MKNIVKEMKENRVVDNPFDVMLHSAIELTRYIGFAAARYRSE